MEYKPRTSLELNIFHIERILKNMKRGETLTQKEYEALKNRFNRLKKQSEAWYEDLADKYKKICIHKSSLKFH